MMEKENKTKDYQLRASRNYDKKFDRITIRLPEGTADVIKSKYGVSVNEYINRLVANDLGLE